MSLAGAVGRAGASGRAKRPRAQNRPPRRYEYDGVAASYDVGAHRALWQSTRLRRCLRRSEPPPQVEDDLLGPAKALAKGAANFGKDIAKSTAGDAETLWDYFRCRAPAGMPTDREPPSDVEATVAGVGFLGRGADKLAKRIGRRLIGKADDAGRAARAAPDDLLKHLPPYAGGKTQGALEIGGRQIDLINGRAGPAASIPKGTPGFDAYVRTHVEGHAAAILRQQGGGRARLVINQVPCPNCKRNLPRALPEGAELETIGPNGFRRTYRGLPD